MQLRAHIQKRLSDKCTGIEGRTAGHRSHSVDRMDDKTNIPQMSDEMFVTFTQTPLSQETPLLYMLSSSCMFALPVSALIMKNMKTLSCWYHCRNVSVCDIVQLHSGWCMYRSRHAAPECGRGLRGRQSVHYQSGHRSFPIRAEQRKRTHNLM